MPENFSWFMYIPAIGHNHELLAVAHSWLVVAVLTIMALLATGKIKRVTPESSSADLIPEDRVTVRNIFDFYTEKILGMMSGLLGDSAPRYFWLIGTLFIYILVSNLLGLIPGLLPPTDNINNNLAMGVFVFVTYHVVGVKEQGLGAYLKHFAGPVLWLAPLMVVVELISHCVRPVTLAIRLFGNINGDHIVLGIFSQLIPEVFSQYLGLLIPVFFLVLGMFVAFVQAFVFSLLSVVYISMAEAHAH